MRNKKRQFQWVIPHQLGDKVRESEYYQQLKQLLENFSKRFQEGKDLSYVEDRYFALLQYSIKRLRILSLVESNVQMSNLILLATWLQNKLTNPRNIQTPKYRYDIERLKAQMQNQMKLIRQTYNSTAEQDIKHYHRHQLMAGKKKVDETIPKTVKTILSTIQNDSEGIFALTQQAINVQHQKQKLKAAQQRALQNRKKMIQAYEEEKQYGQRALEWSNSNSLKKEKSILFNNLTVFSDVYQAVKNQIGQPSRDYDQYLRLLNSNKIIKSPLPKVGVVELDPKKQQIPSQKIVECMIKQKRIVKNKLSMKMMNKISQTGVDFFRERKSEEMNEINEIDSLKKECLRRNVKVSYQTLKRGLFSGSIESVSGLKGMATGLMQFPLQKQKKTRKK